jgi:hypothetical protein
LRQSNHVSGGFAKQHSSDADGYRKIAQAIMTVEDEIKIKSRAKDADIEQLARQLCRAVEKNCHA